MKPDKFLVKYASAQEECLRFLQNCNTPDEIRRGLARVADVIAKVKPNDSLVAPCRQASQPGALSDPQLHALKEKFVTGFREQAQFFRGAAKQVSKADKPWWRFW